MLYKILADIVVLFHLLWIVFLIIGAFWGVKYRIIKYLHIGGIFFSIFLQIMGWYCPLTYLEVWLRGLHSPKESYPGSFIAHYAERIIYIEVSGVVIFILTITLLIANLLAYRKR